MTRVLAENARLYNCYLAYMFEYNDEPLRLGRRVVEDFVDVFLKDFSGLPPESRSRISNRVDAFLG